MLRIFGSILVIAGCGGFGFSLAHTQKKEEQMLRQLIKALQEMEWELKYRITPLPELCMVGAAAARGPVREVLIQLSDRLNRGDFPQVSECMNGLASDSHLPRRLRNCLREVGQSLGRYDLEGQIQGLAAVRLECRGELEELKEGGAERLRCYQTLSICAGVALAILLI